MRHPAAIALLVCTGLAGVSAAQAQLPWVMLGRRVIGHIEHMQHGPSGSGPVTDIATVVVDAPAARVYETALAHARRNPAVTIVSQDAKHRRLELIEGDRRATLSVADFGEDLSQLIIAGTASAGEQPTASRVVGAVLRVCEELHKQCSVGG